MAQKSGAPGCRSVAIATLSLISVAVIFMILGLTLVNDTTCSGTCETIGLTFLYAGLPVSALFGVLFGDLVVAWPLDITLWVVIGFGIARFVERRGRSVVGGLLAIVVIALVYGLVLSQFVEIAIP